MEEQCGRQAGRQATEQLAGLHLPTLMCQNASSGEKTLNKAVNMLQHIRVPHLLRQDLDHLQRKCDRPSLSRRHRRGRLLNRQTSSARPPRGPTFFFGGGGDQKHNKRWWVRTAQPTQNNKPSMSEEGERANSKQRRGGGRGGGRGACEYEKTTAVRLCALVVVRMCHEGLEAERRTAAIIASSFFSFVVM